MKTTENIRLEKDSLGKVGVAADKYWGAQTQRAVEHFAIGNDKMPVEIIHAFGIIKLAAARVNSKKSLSRHKADLIGKVCEEIISGLLDEHFPLKVWQSGSGTQTNMNVNEVIANRAAEIAGEKLGQKHPIHPNDDVNMSQSSNDTFPSAMHIATVLTLKNKLLPILRELNKTLTKKQRQFAKIIKIGRTHLQDAVPLTLGQEFSGYAAQIASCIKNINSCLPQLTQLAIGGTAVGTGLNAPNNFAEQAVAEISSITGIKFTSAPNKFAALASHDSIVMASGALRTLAASLMKIANDIRLLGSGPRCGLNELTLPANEPGSSIMPGKINPTQCEALTMICIEVMGNDATIGFAGSQGHFELNVYKPLMIYKALKSINLLADGCCNFIKYTLAGLRANKKQIAKYVESSLMLVTALVPKIGYDKAAKVAQTAIKENLTLKQAAVKLQYLSEQDFAKLVQPGSMI